MCLMNQSDIIHSFTRSFSKHLFSNLNVVKLLGCASWIKAIESIHLFVHTSSTHVPIQMLSNCIDQILMDQSNMIYSSIFQVPIFQFKCCESAWIKANIIQSSIVQAPFFQSKLHRYILLQHALWIKAILSIHPLFKHPFLNLNFIGTYCFNAPYGSKQY